MGEEFYVINKKYLQQKFKNVLGSTKIFMDIIIQYYACYRKSLIRAFEGKFVLKT